MSAYDPKRTLHPLTELSPQQFSGEVRKLVDRNDFQIKELEPLHALLSHCFCLFKVWCVENRKEAGFIPYLV